MKENQMIYGLRPVIEAIRGGIEIEKIYIQSSLQGQIFQELKQELQKRPIVLQYVPIEKLNRLTYNNHQGVVAIISPIGYSDLEEILTATAEKGKKPFVLMLDRVTDVRNLGAIARTAECAGVDAIIIPQHNSAPINGDAIKTSAGALLRIPICRQHNLKTSIHLARQMGLSVYAATEKTDSIYTEANFNSPLLLIMGSEETGVSNDLLKLCDDRLKIPLAATIESLNVSVAAGIIMYEVVRQRSLK